VNPNLEQAVDTFLAASVNGRLGRAGRLLAEHPEIAEYDVGTAIALGDAPRVRAELERDPDLPVRRDPRTGWTALHLACASRWHVDPARREGLAAIVGMLLDAGADIDRTPTAESQWSPLRCAIASAGSGRGGEAIVGLLLERGVKVEDDDLYLAGFATGGDQWCVRLLVRYTPSVSAIAEKALAAPISLDDVEAVRVLLEAGADPRRYRDDDGQPTAVIRAAIDAGCSVELIELLLTHGAGDDMTAFDHLLYACRRGDRSEAQRLVDQEPGLRSEVAGADGSALIGAADAGDREAIALLLEVGFPVAAAGLPNGATALHAAAWAGSPEVVAQLLAAGAPIDALDSEWHSTPLVWALVGSGERSAPNPTPDWMETVRVLLDAGAGTTGIDLDSEDPIQPSPEVVELLRARGVVT
jgi:ankyrin repeat protein